MATGDDGEAGGCSGTTEGDGGRDMAAFGYVALMVLIGSSTATAAKFAVRELPWGLLPVVRFGVAGLCLLPLVWGALGRMVRQDGWRLLATAALCVPVNQTFFLNGTKLAPTTHVGLIYAACPLVVLLLACLLGQERLVLGRVAGVVATVAGVALIAIGNLFEHKAAGAGSLRGDLLLLGAVTSWGAYLTVSKPLVARHGALPALAGTFLVGALLSLPILLTTRPTWPDLSLASAAAWRGLAFLTLVVSLVALTCQNQALRRLDASQVATFGNVAPLLTIVWGAWFLGEPITPLLIVGGALTLGGVFWTGRRPAPRAV